MARKKEQRIEVQKTGWPAGLMQDDDKKLSKWFASRLDARRVVRDVCKQIEGMAKRTSREPRGHPIA